MTVDNDTPMTMIIDSDEPIRDKRSVFLSAIYITIQQLTFSTLWRENTQERSSLRGVESVSEGFPTVGLPVYSNV